MSQPRPYPTWLQRLLLIPTLRTRMEVVALTRGCANLYAVECSADEMDELKRVDAHLLVDLANALRYEVGVSAADPLIRVLCFGRGARTELISQPIRLSLASGSTCFWMTEFRTAITTFRDGHPILGQLLHEVTHGLLAELSNRFPYPYAVEEGFARLASDWVALDPHDAVDLTHHLNGHWFPVGSVDDSQCVSIKQLLQFRPYDDLPVGEEDRRQYLSELGRASNASVWLIAYLALLGRHRPTVRRILREVREKNIRSPGAIYEWLLHVSGMTPEALERGFRLYCTEGITP